MTKRFLLCIGCQKGGTTWLADYLRNTPGVRLGAMKEMHVLDAHFFASTWQRARIARVERQVASLPADDATRARLAKDLAGLRLCQSLVGDLDAYARYFRNLAEDADLVADITPNYALLSAAQWTEVRAALDRNGLAPKVLFLMRDPEPRLESAWRMRERDTDSRKAAWRSSARGRLGALAPWRAIRRRSPREEPYMAFAADGSNIARSRYETTIRAIEAAFPAGDIHYEFYETLFRPEALSAINAFLGLPDRPADFGSRFNASPVEAPIAAGERVRARDMLDPTYRFCAERFGEEKIRKIWKAF